MEGQFKTLLQTLRNIRNENGIYLAEIFEKLPSKKQLPHYYQIIKNPIDLQTIENKFSQNLYSSMDLVFDDIRLMIDNAHLYNDENSDIYSCATSFRNQIDSIKESIDIEVHSTPVKRSSRKYISTENIIDFGERRTRRSHLEVKLNYSNKSSRIRNKTQNIKINLNKLFDTIKDSSDPNNFNRKLAPPFVMLPKKSLYPDYYDIISNPICLNQIRAKINNGTYLSMEDMKYDLKVLFNNAFTYNHNTSIIYQDAAYLLNIVEEYPLDCNEENVINESVPSLEPVKRKKEKDPNSLIIMNYSLLPIKYSKLLKAYQAIRKIEEFLSSDFIGFDILYIPTILSSPNYYHLYHSCVQNPIDLSHIYNRIKQRLYGSEIEFLADFKLLSFNFNSINTKHSIPEIIKIIEKIEKLLLTKFGQTWSLAKPDQGKSVDSFFNPFLLSNKPEIFDQNTDINEAVFEMLSFIKSYNDINGRNLYYTLQLETNKDYRKFSKKTDFNNIYEFLNEFSNKMELICKQNQSLGINSSFYQDTIALFFGVVEYTRQLYKCSHIEMSPKKCMNFWINKIWDVIESYEDDYKHFYYFSLKNVVCEVPIVNSVNICETFQPSKRLISYNIIEKAVRNNYYQRFEVFQNDFILLCHQVRKQSNIYSERFKDASELPMVFIRARDSICTNLETNATMLSTATIYTQIEQDHYSAVALYKDESDLFLNITISNLIDYHNVSLDKIFENATPTRCSTESETIEFEENEEEQEESCSSEEDSEYSIIFDSDRFNYKMGYCVSIYIPKKCEILITGFIAKRGYDQIFVVGCLLTTPQKIHHTYDRSYFKNEKLVLNTLIITDIANIVSILPIYHVGQISLDGEKKFPLKHEFYQFLYSEKTQDFYNINQITFVRCKLLASDFEGKKNVKIVNSELISRDLIINLKNPFFSQEEECFLNKMNQFTFEMRNTTYIEKILMISNEVDDGKVHYLQLPYRNTLVKRDGYVYVYDDDDGVAVVKIKDIFHDKNNENDFYIMGQLFVNYDAFNYHSTRFYYPNEVFRTKLVSKYHLDLIYDHCQVIHYKEFFNERPIGCDERNVFICESMFDPTTGSVRRIKPFATPMSPHPHIIQEEIFHYSEPLIIFKKPSPTLRMDYKKVLKKQLLAPRSKRNKRSSNNKKQEIVKDDSSDFTLSPYKDEPLKSSFIDHDSRMSFDSKSKGEKKYKCRWFRCELIFSSLHDLYNHIMNSGDHINENSLTCMWKKCSKSKKTFHSSKAILKHVREYHFKLKKKDSFNDSPNVVVEHKPAEIENAFTSIIEAQNKTIKNIQNLVTELQEELFQLKNAKKLPTVETCVKNEFLDSNISDNAMNKISSDILRLLKHRNILKN